MKELANYLNKRFGSLDWSLYLEVPITQYAADGDLVDVYIRAELALEGDEGPLFTRHSYGRGPDIGKAAEDALRNVIDLLGDEPLPSQSP